jgi:hypothetical protein
VPPETTDIPLTQPEGANQYGNLSPVIELHINLISKGSDNFPGEKPDKPGESSPDGSEESGKGPML